MDIRVQLMIQLTQIQSLQRIIIKHVGQNMVVGEIEMDLLILTITIQLITYKPQVSELMPHCLQIMN
jgi:hypothetical protein